MATYFLASQGEASGSSSFSLPVVEQERFFTFGLSFPVWLNDARTTVLNAYAANCSAYVIDLIHSHASYTNFSVSGCGPIRLWVP